MLQTMTSRAARDNFADLLGAVYYGKQTIKITKKNKIMAVAVNPEVFAAMQRAAKMKFATILEDQKVVKNKTEEDIVVADAIRAVDEVRADIYDRYQHAKKAKTG